jgi:flagellar basal-body rod protein FlgB
MSNSIDQELAFQSRALTLLGHREQLLASNIANADTPNYKAMDIDFAKALRRAQGAAGDGVALARTSSGHLGGGGGNSALGVKPLYRTAVQPSIDGNTVDTNIEQAKFAENALQYMATLQFMNGKIQSTLLALRGGN